MGKRQRQLKAFVQQELREAGVNNGVSVAAVKGGQIVWAGAFGKCSALPDAPDVEKNTKFLCASVSKTFIGVTAAWMQEKGYLELEAPINTMLPYEIVNPNFPDVPITLLQLIIHTSSIVDDNYDQLDDEEIYAVNDCEQPLSGRKCTMDEFYRKLLLPDGELYSAENFSDKQPGTGYKYSNAASSFGAHICELVARDKGIIEPEGTFDDLVHLAILGPLGVPQDDAAYLCSSFSGPEAAVKPRVAIPSFFEEGEEHMLFTMPDYPNGGMLSTATAYAHMLAAIINDGQFNGVEFLKPETCQYIKQIHYEGEDDEGEPQRQAVSFYGKSAFGRQLLGHNGSETGVASEAFWNPETGVGFVILCNEGWDNEDMSDSVMAIEKEILDTFEPPEYVKRRKICDEEGEEEDDEEEDEWGEDGEEEEDWEEEDEELCGESVQKRRTRQKAKVKGTRPSRKKSRKMVKKKQNLSADANTQIKAAFEAIDANGDGTINKEEMRDFFPNFDDDDFDKLWQAADPNGDGKVKYSEFVEWIMKDNDGNEEDAVEAALDIQDDAYGE